ncbi:right-handed parallel beta-helix repeat-containing protein, partial [Candidatus Bathyarchaeota archaeon]|nr:right-handed parallel beta-helix repeat-containing protein [Candidatus Bathyarchaeota archaeon]
MFRRFFSGMMLTLLLISILTLAFNIQPVRATTIIVPDHYSTIQEAIHAASSGDTILVKAGTYSENVVVNKRLTITSESGADVTIVQAANPAKHVFQVDTVDYVNINGFTVRGSKGSPGVRPSGAGICLFYANHCNISNNVASDNQDGIFVSWYSSDNILTENKANLNSRNGIFLYGSSNKLRDNTMSNNAFNFGIGGGDYIHDIDTSNTVNGKPIYYWVNKQNKEVPSDARYVGIVNCINITIMDLVLSNNEQGVLFVNVNNSKIKNVNVRSMKEFGIYLKSSSNNIVANNSINSSSRLSGIGLSSSNNNSVINNIISNNQDGIRLYGSNNNTISNNHILNNRRGILLSSSSNNTITTNIVNSNNGTGIYLEYSSSNNAVINNNVLNNMYGIAFYSYGPLNNTIYLNNFNNTNNVGYSTYASIGKWNSPSPIIYTYNGSTYTNYLGNYWSD